MYVRNFEEAETRDPVQLGNAPNGLLFTAGGLGFKADPFQAFVSPREGRAD